MLVDTNIIVYAINADSPKNQTAQSFLQENVGALIITHQNIFETLRVLTHPKFSNPMKSYEAKNALEPIIKACKIIYPNNKTHHLALELIQHHNVVGNQIFDAYLAATALSNNVVDIATDNEKDFKIFNVNILNPFKK